MNDTIAAISTGSGGGIGIVRLSGGNAEAILRSLFRGSSGGFESNRLYYGHITGEDGAVIDEVMVALMRAPRSYTGEDVAEISCHGGARVMRDVLEALIRRGARHAQSGEFTKRAFLNGRMDLSRAEAVMDIIGARTEPARRAAVSGLTGRLTAEIEVVSNRLLECLSSIEASIDYPEYDETTLQTRFLRDSLNALTGDLERVICRSRDGRIIREGIGTVILGRPNVGKSSLLNALMDEERAIVTDIPGTTRDVLSEHIQLAGVPLNISDTAGIRGTEDIIERMGVERSAALAQSSDLILLLLDGSAPLTADDEALLSRYGGRNALVLVNKSDLKCGFDMNALPSLVSDCAGIIPISAKVGWGLDTLADRIRELFLGAEQPDWENLPAAANVRQLAALEQALEALRRAVCGLDSGIPEDMLAIDISAAYDALGEITGRSVGEDLIDNIFSRFCLGK